MTHLERRLTGGILVLVGASTMLLYGCSRSTEQPQGVQQSTGPQEMSVPPAISINELMVAWIDHSGHELWDVESEGRAPKTDADWREVERHATQIAAAGTLVTLGGTGQADPGWAQSPLWKKDALELTKAGLAARDAARGKNFEGLVKANGQLVEVCESCHKEFKPDLPTEGKAHQPH
jgi:hypothetical protein